MKILAILNDDSTQKEIEILGDLQEENDVEVISLVEKDCNYDEIVNKIEKCDKVISW